jgi:hypothetical protein
MGTRRYSIQQEHMYRTIDIRGLPLELHKALTELAELLELVALNLVSLVLVVHNGLRANNNGLRGRSTIAVCRLRNNLLLGRITRSRRIGSRGRSTRVARLRRIATSRRIGTRRRSTGVARLRRITTRRHTLTRRVGTRRRSSRVARLRRITTRRHTGAWRVGSRHRGSGHRRTWHGSTWHRGTWHGSTWHTASDSGRRYDGTGRTAEAHGSNSQVKLALLTLVAGKWDPHVLLDVHGEVEKIHVALTNGIILANRVVIINDASKAFLLRILDLQLMNLIPNGVKSSLLV